MKKLKSILCVALFLVFGAVLFVGCGPNKKNPANKQTTITLAEAKTIIVNALAIDESVQTMAYAVENEEEGNRDVFVKFGKSKFVASSTMEQTNNPNMNTKTDETIWVDKTNGTWNKYILDTKTQSNFQDAEDNYVKGYYDGQDVYNDMSGYKSKTSFDDSFSTLEIKLINYMFSEEAFATLYKNNVTKTTNSSDFELALSIDIYQFYCFFYANSEVDMGDFSFEDMWETMPDEEKNTMLNGSKVEVVITFDNNSNITKVNLDMVTNNAIDKSFIIKSTLKAELTKYTGEIEEPQWVTDYKATQNQ